MIGPICREKMRTVTAAYAEATGRSIDAISRKYYGKSGLLAEFIAGRVSMNISVYDKVMNKIMADMATLQSPGTTGTDAVVDK